LGLLTLPATRSIPPRAELKRKLGELAVPMEKYKLTQDNFEKLFPNGRVATPLGKVKLGENQFAKLKARNQEDLLGATFQTLSDPVAVLDSDRDGRKARMYVRSFKKEAGLSTVVSVVVDQFDGTKPIRVPISTHRKDTSGHCLILCKRVVFLGFHLFVDSLPALYACVTRIP